MAAQVVLVDTNAIIEAVRTRCWSAIAAHFDLETVEECRAESMRGDSTRPSYVRVTEAELDLAATHAVTALQRATLALRCASADGLDGGERDLIAHAIARPDEWQLCSPDKASIRAAVELGCHERLASLELLARGAGVRPALPLYDHHTERRLREWRTAALLGVL